MTEQIAKLVMRLVASGAGPIVAATVVAEAFALGAAHTARRIKRPGRRARG